MIKKEQLERALWRTEDLATELGAAYETMLENSKKMRQDIAGLAEMIGAILGAVADEADEEEE
jgi:ketopantoate reductase